MDTPFGKARSFAEPRMTKRQLRKFVKGMQKIRKRWDNDPSMRAILERSKEAARIENPWLYELLMKEYPR